MAICNIQYVSNYQTKYFQQSSFQLQQSGSWITAPAKLVVTDLLENVELRLGNRDIWLHYSFSDMSFYKRLFYIFHNSIQTINNQPRK